MGKKPEIPPEDLMECDDCNTKLPENDLAYTEHHGKLCVKCYKNEYPNHIIDPTESSWTGRPETITITLDADDGDGFVVIDKKTGIAGYGKTKAKARKIMDKAVSDVETVERNERYGSCME